MGFDTVTKGMSREEVSREDARKLAMDEFEDALESGDVLTDESEIADYMYWNVIPSNWALPEDRADELTGVMTEMYLTAVKNNLGVGV